MTDELQTQPPVPAKNKGGRPRKDKVADSLKETLRQIESLLLLDHPSPAKSRLLGAKLEFYMGEQKFEREQKPGQEPGGERAIALEQRNAARPAPSGDQDRREQRAGR